MTDDSTILAATTLPSLREVCESPADFLGNLDVGALNLMCAAGLPGAEDLDISKQLEWLDEAAPQVDLQTRSRFDQFSRSPNTYNNSPGQFCCNYLLRTLQELLGVQYNPARIADLEFLNPHGINPDFRDARDLFIHGMMGGPGGTCASMPVIYVAVGRRLGYPLKLVETRGHLFFRWDDPEGQRFNVPERFNVEGAGDGMSFYCDDFYRTWPTEWRPIDKTGNWYLKSLSPTEELAAFLATRGSCLEDNGRFGDAIQAFGWAAKLVSDDFRYESHLVKLLKGRYEEGIAALETEQRLLDMDRTMFHQENRRLESAFDQVGGPPHGNHCQCIPCRHLREAAQQPRTPAHRPGCGCVSCLRGNSNPFNSW